MEALLGWAERMGPGYHFVILDFTVTVRRPRPEPVAGGDAAGRGVGSARRTCRSWRSWTGSRSSSRAHAVID